jgi:hypothetical protein
MQAGIPREIRVLAMGEIGSRWEYHPGLTDWDDASISSFWVRYSFS